MHILIVDIKWPAETFLKRKIEGLAERGDQITVAVSSQDTKLTSPHLNINLVRLPSWRDPVLKRIWSALPMLGSISGYNRLSSLWKAVTARSLKARFNFVMRSLPLTSIQPDIIHFEWNASAFEYLPLLSIWSCPMVVSCRGSQVKIAPHNPRRHSHTKGLGETFQKATAIHCVSEDIKSEAINYGAPVDKIWVIRPAVDPEFFFPLNIGGTKNERFTIVSTGSVIWQKGYEYALLALRKLVDSGVGVQYKIIGGGPEQQRIRYTIDDLDLQSHVQLLGSHTPTEVRDQLQRADAFMLSSLSEGISNAVLEAMACGLPVVTTDCGGMREAVTDGVEGFVVSVRDSDAMANALTRLAQDPALRRNMGKAGRTRILREFTLSQQIELFAEMYSQICRKNVS